MLKATVAGKRVGCWGTMVMRERRVGMWRCERGMLLIVRVPDESG